MARIIVFMIVCVCFKVYRKQKFTHQSLFVFLFSSSRRRPHRPPDFHHHNGKYTQTHTESCATKRGLISDYRRCLAVSVQTTTWSAGVIKYSASWTTIRALVSVTQTALALSLSPYHWWISPLYSVPQNLTHITISLLLFLSLSRSSIVLACIVRHGMLLSFRGFVRELKSSAIHLKSKFASMQILWLRRSYVFVSLLRFSFPLSLSV